MDDHSFKPQRKQAPYADYSQILMVWCRPWYMMARPSSTRLPYLNTWTRPSLNALFRQSILSAGLDAGLVALYWEKPTPAVRYPTFNRILIAIIRIFRTTILTPRRNTSLKTDFYKQMGRDGFDDDAIDRAVGNIRSTVERMEKALAGGTVALAGLFPGGHLCCPDRSYGRFGIRVTLGGRFAACDAMVQND